jgi:hypothetical protein
MLRLIDIVLLRPLPSYPDSKDSSRGLQEAYPHAVVLHQLVNLGEEFQYQREAHRKLLHAYETTKTGEGWHTAPDDGYLYDHLAMHLREAEDYTGLRRLFLDDHWLQARVQQSHNRLTGYQQDLEHAWQATDKQMLADEAALVDGVRYALTQQQLKNRFRTLPPPVLERLVELGLMTIEQAEARHPPNAFMRVIFRRQRNLSNEPISVLLARILQTPPNQALLPYEAGEPYTFETITPTQYEQLIDFILTAPPNDGFAQERVNDEFLSSLAPHLSSDYIARFLKALENTRQGASAFQALIIFISNTPPEIHAPWLPDIVTYLLGSSYFKSPHNHEGTELSGPSLQTICNQIRQILPYLSQNQIDEFIYQTIYNVQVSYRPPLMAVLSPWFSSEQRVKTIFSILNTLPRNLSLQQELETLTPLIASLEPSDVVNEVVDALLALNPSGERSRLESLLIHLLPKLSLVQQRRLIPDLLTETLRMDELTNASINLARLIPFLNEPELSTTLDVIRDLPLTKRFGVYQYEEAYAPYCLALMLPHLTGEIKAQLLTQAFELTLQLPAVVYGFEHVKSLLARNASRLLPHLEGDMYQQLAERALDAIFFLPERHHGVSRPRMEELSRFMPLCNPYLVQKVLEIFAVRRVGWVISRIHTVQTSQWGGSTFFISTSLVSTFAPYLSEDQIDDAFYQTMKMSRYSPATSDDFGSNYEHDWSANLKEFIPLVSEKVLEEIFNQAVVPNRHKYSIDLETVLSHLSEDQIRRALKRTISLGNEAEALQRTHQLENSEEPEAYHDNAYDVAFGATLTELIPYLPADMWEKALRAAYNIQTPYYRAQVLALLAVRLEGVTRRRILRAIRDTVMERTFRAASLYREPHTRYNILAQVASVLDLETLRKDVAGALKDEAVEALIVMQAYLPDAEEQAEIIAQALEITLKQRENIRGERLRQLGPFLSDEQITIAASTVLAQPQTYDTLMNLIGLAHIVRAETDIQSLLDYAFSLRDPYRTRKVVELLVPKLTINLLRDLIEKIRLNKAAERLPALIALMPHLSHDEQLELLPETLATMSTLELWDVYGDSFGLILNQDLAAVAFRQAPQIANLLIRLRLLSYLADYDNDTVEQDLRSLFRETLKEALHTEAIYDLLADWRVFRPPRVSSEHMAQIATMFGEISWDWRWEVLAQVTDVVA